MFVPYSQERRVDLTNQPWHANSLIQAAVKGYRAGHRYVVSPEQFDVLAAYFRRHFPVWAEHPTILGNRVIVRDPFAGMYA